MLSPANAVVMLILVNVWDPGPGRSLFALLLERLVHAEATCPHWLVLVVR